MKVLVLLFACVALASALSKPFELRHGPPPPPPADRQARDAVWGMFEARVDNFDPNNRDTWNMRYIENNQFHTPGGPIFIFLGAEVPIGIGWAQGGLMFDMARTNRGAIYLIEHRYYGRSFPVYDLSSNNLRFLSAEQAMEDAANFIRSLKEKPDFQNSKVVVTGGSYGGAMATWMRSQYPNLVHAAWSSSGPVLAKVDFSEYNEVVSQDLSACTHIIRNGVQEVQRLLQSTEGIQKVSRDFNTCYPLDGNNFSETSYLFFNIFIRLGGSVQSSTTASLKALCDKLDNPNYASDYDKLVSFFRITPGCVPDYKNAVAYYSQTGLLDTPGTRQWFYQTCTEFGFFQTSTSPNQPFAGMPVDMYHMWCRDYFGENFTPQLVHAGAAAKNQRYGGLNPNVTRLVSTHGTYDPWHALGLTHDVNSDAPVIIIPNASHCPDMYSVSFDDAQPIRDAKLRIQRLINQWLML